MILQPNARDKDKATIIIGRGVICTLWKGEDGVIIKIERLATIAELEQIIAIAKDWNQ